MPNDYPITELVEMAERTLNEIPGSAIHFLFTCEACGERCAFDDANVYYEAGECEACGHVTPFTMGGFRLVVPLGAKNDA